MALLDLLLLVFAMVMARAISRVMGGVMEGLSGRASRSEGGNVPARGVQMVRDPVCGTFVIPDRAVALSVGSGRVFFCSANCRDKYRARPSTQSASSGSPVEGRTA
jgi:YHS domain-containing protein